MVLGTDIGARRHIETDGEDGAAIEPAIDVGVGHGLKPLDGLRVVLDVLVEDISIGRLKVLAVHDTWNVQGRVAHIIGRVWLVERGIANNVRIVSKSSRCGIPVCSKLVVHIVLVCEESAESCNTLLRVIVVSEHLLKAVLNQVVAVLVNTVAQVIHVTTWVAMLGVEVFKELVNERIDA